MNAEPSTFINERDLTEIALYGTSKKTTLIEQTLVVGGTPCFHFNDILLNQTKRGVKFFQKQRHLCKTKVT